MWGSQNKWAGEATGVDPAGGPVLGACFQQPHEHKQQDPFSNFEGKLLSNEDLPGQCCCTLASLSRNQDS